MQCSNLTYNIRISMLPIVGLSCRVSSLRCATQTWLELGITHNYIQLIALQCTRTVCSDAFQVCWLPKRNFFSFWRRLSSFFKLRLVIKLMITSVSSIFFNEFRLFWLIRNHNYFQSLMLNSQHSSVNCLYKNVTLPDVGLCLLECTPSLHTRE